MPLLRALVIVLACAGLAEAQVSRLDTATANTGSQTMSYTVSAGSGTDRYLVVCHAQEAGDPVQEAVTYGTVAMTHLVGIVVGSSTLARVDLFGCDEACLDAASSTTIDTQRALTAMAIHAASYDGVDQTTPDPEENTDSTATATPNPITNFPITAGTDAAVVACAASGSSGTTTWAGVTEQTDVDAASSFISSVGDNLGSGTIDPEPTFTAQNRAVGASQELAPAAASSGPPNPLLLLGAGPGN